MKIRFPADKQPAQADALGGAPMDEIHEPERAIETTPTQVQYPWRAAVRTALAVLVAIASGVLSILPEVSAIADDTITPLLPAQLVDVLARASVVVVAVATCVTRVMAAPSVNALLTRLGLGAVPKA